MNKPGPAPEPVRVRFPGNQTAELRDVGGSFNGEFNSVLANQIMNTLWMGTDREIRDKQVLAAFAPMVVIKLADEIEGMLAAQMGATHNVAIKCFRRSILREQSFEGRRENPTQANNK